MLRCVRGLEIDVMKRMAVCGVLAAVYVTCFCGTYRHDVDRQKYMDLALAKEFDCVGQVYVKGASKGTAELIDKKYAISAAHVFVEKDGTNGRRVIAPGDCAIAFNGKRYAVANLVVYPEYLNEGTKNDCDIVLIELEQEIADIVPAVINTDTNEMHAVATCVGYGASGPATKFDEYDYDVKIAGENVIDSMGGKSINGQAPKLVFDFDSPDDSTLNTTGDRVPRPLEYHPNGGDSGGGMFINKDGKWLLAGLTSGSHSTIRPTSGYYGSTAYYTRVSAYAGWIVKTMGR